MTQEKPLTQLQPSRRQVAIFLVAPFGLTFLEEAPA